MTSYAKAETLAMMTDPFSVIGFLKSALGRARDNLAIDPEMARDAIDTSLEVVEAYRTYCYQHISHVPPF